MNETDSRPAVVGQVEPSVGQHTPGPWRQDRRSVLIPLAPYEYAEAYGGTEANARLIAAAPELLEALLTAEALLYAHRKPIDPAITAALVKAGVRAA